VVYHVRRGLFGLPRGEWVDPSSRMSLREFITTVCVIIPNREKLDEAIASLPPDYENKEWLRNQITEALSL
jgi:hypothetical protein